MMELILLIGMFAVVIWAFLTNILWGLLSLLVVGVYYYFRRYASLCFRMALKNYNEGNINGCFRWFERGNKRGMTATQKITYAYYLMREGRIERSEALLNSILAFPQKGNVKYLAKMNHALLMLKTGHLQDAQEEYEEIYPHFKNTSLYGSMGYLYIITGEMEKAKTFNHEAYEFNKENAVILDNLVQMYNKLEDFETAYRFAGELLEQKPGFVEAYFNIAVTEIALGKLEDAKQHLEHALTIRTTFLSSIHHEDVQKLLDSLN